MKRETPGRLTSRGFRGQAMVETLVVAAIAIALIALPWDGKPGSDSVLVFMLKAIKTAFAKFVGALSLPI